MVGKYLIARDLNRSGVCSGQDKVSCFLDLSFWLLGTRRPVGHGASTEAAHSGLPMIAGRDRRGLPLFRVRCGRFVAVLRQRIYQLSSVQRSNFCSFARLSGHDNFSFLKAAFDFKVSGEQLRRVGFASVR